MTKRKAKHCDEDVLGGDDHEDEDSHDDDDDGAEIDCSSSKKAAAAAAAAAATTKSRSKLQPKLKKPKRSYSSSLLSQQKQKNKQEQEEGGDSDTVNTASATPTTTATTTTTALYVDEVVRPEWIALPQELAMIDFHHYYKENAEETTPNATPPRLPPAAWGKYAPYYQITQHLPITPIQTPPIFTPNSPALCYYLNGLDGRARCGTLHFPSAGPPVTTPRFMPVGTKGTLKGVLPDEIAQCQCPIILANTYHLAIQPGTKMIQNLFQGLHNFMGGTTIDERPERDEDNKEGNEDDRQEENEQEPKHPTPTAQPKRTPKRRRLYNLLTDSGGFQMVSLASLSVVTEQGVQFQSPYTHDHIMLRPEDSIRCQNDIGADIIMQLDDVIASTQSDRARFHLATLRTLRWYDRCVRAHQSPMEQNLFPILQGHLDVSPGGLRELCLAGFKHRDVHGPVPQNDNSKDNSNDNTNHPNPQPNHHIPGFAIGGLAGGESKDEFWKVVDHACRHLPDDRPRYLMGVGYPLDLVVCTALGVDMYDCVYPTRTARFGVALLDAGQLKLKRHEYAPGNPMSAARDGPIDRTCPCEACSRGITRSRLHFLLKANNPLAIQLLTQHNVVYMMGLVTRMRNAILAQTFSTFVKEFIATHFPPPPPPNNTGNANDDTKGNKNVNVPQWVQDALMAAGIVL